MEKDSQKTNEIFKLNICDVLRDLELFVQFKNTHGRVLLLVKLQASAFATLLKVSLLYGCFSRFLSCKNATKCLK